MLTIDRVNAMSESTFVTTFGDIAEHSPWVATVAAGQRPFADKSTLIDAFAAAVREATREKQLALLRAHPDLAGRAAIAGQLTDDSRREQAGAGLDSLTEDEFAQFTRLNSGYIERFKFPFIFAVKGATKHQILAAFEQRINNGVDDEFATAVGQVLRIIGFRIEDAIVDSEPA